MHVCIALLKHFLYNMVVQRRRRTDSVSPDSSIEAGDSSSDESDVNSKARADVNERSIMTVYRVCRVLTAVLMFAFVLVVSSSRTSASKPLTFQEAKMIELNAQRKPDHVLVVMTEEEGLDQLPPMELDPHVAIHDAFGVAQQYLKNHTSSFMKLANQMQEDYAGLYGGIRPSRHMLENTLHEFGGDAWVRLLQRKRNSILRMAIVGDATAAGYGNYHNQAFSFNLQETMEKVMSSFKIDFQVTNVALEHVPTFPYLWCIPEFVQMGKSGGETSIDVVYVDLGPSLSASDLELIVRQILGLSTPAPLLILRDKKDDDGRMELLQHYLDGGNLRAPVLMDWEDAVEPFLRVKPSRRPVGFADWMLWGAAELPHKRSYWTPAQHKMVAWVLAMFFLKQLELLVAAEAGLYQLEVEQEGEIHSPILAKASALKEPWAKYLFFPSSFRKCMTSFDPANNLLPSSGSVTQDVHLEHPKGMAFYTSGWVLDMENSERKEKLRSQHHGFKDVLASYHGIAASGTLAFDFDLEATSELIVCESQAPSEPTGCRLDQDVEFTINGQPVKSVRRIATDSVSYQGKRHCVFIEFESRESGYVQFGMMVTNKTVMINSGPCSISHIIWQDNDGDEIMKQHLQRY